jgi:hypothetical protein
MRRERHVGGADLHRDHPVREADERRHDRAEHHDQPVHRGELVELLGTEELPPGLEQLEPDAQREHPADRNIVNENNRYIVPMSLWFVAKSHRRQPVGCREHGHARGRDPSGGREQHS